MPVDTSLYQISTPAPVQVPSYADNLQKGLSIKQMQMQNQQMQLQMQTQQAMRDAYKNNTGQDGSLNQQGFLSDLGKASPQAAMEYSKQFNEMAKQRAEMQKAQNEAFQQKQGVVAGAMDYLNGIKDTSARAAAYGNVRNKLIKDGVITPQDAPEQYQEDWFRQTHELAKQSTQYLNNQNTAAKTAEAWSNVATAPAKHNAELYGSRSPNAELTAQYDKQAAPIRSSQLAMQQMYDNYHHPSPQGDASLVLNAFKIKFPNAPDVNSLEELTKSQAAPDQWKQWAAHATAGGLDQGTRDNLMRDAASTFRANYDSLKGIQQRYQARAKQQNVNDPTLTAEPAIEDTYKNVMGLQDKIGPYVPPAERGGGILSSIGKMFSSSEPKTANAKDAPSSLPPPPDGMIHMQGPDGKIRYIPKSMKGEAIAAGGKVIK